MGRRIRIGRRMGVGLLLLLAAGCSENRGDSAAGPLGVEDAVSVGLSGGGHAAIATGGYHFLVPEDFNGGIFGGAVGNRLTFNAKRDGNGTVSGHYVYEQEFMGDVFRFSGPVTCFRVHDTPVLQGFPDIPAMTANRAKWGGVVATSNDPTIPVGTFIWFNSIDNGEGAQSPPDLSSISGFGDEAANEAFCNSTDPPNPNFGPHALDGGNIQVR